MNNSMMVIRARREHNYWVFDDTTRDLKGEAFVMGAEKLIDRGCKEILDDENLNEVTLMFSANPFPGFHYELNKEEEEFGGNWYSMDEHRAWICPATLLFFETYPEKIFIRLEK